MHSLVGRVVSCSFARAPLLHRHNVRCFSVLSRFATIDPKALSGTERLQNLVNGQWVDPKSHVTIKDPMTGRPMVNVPSTQVRVKTILACALASMAARRIIFLCLGR